MPANDPVVVALEGLGVAAGDDPLGVAIELVRREPQRAGALVDRLSTALARVEDDALAGRALVALGRAQLAARDAARARETLVEARAAVRDDARTAARAELAHACALVALGDARAARAELARSFGAILSLEEDGSSSELATALRAAGEPLAADAVERVRRGRREGGAARETDRLEVLGRLARALKSGAAGTAEPLYAVLRAILDETGADRGFVLLYRGSTLRFELGLGRSGRILGEGDFEFSRTIVEKALEAGTPLLVPDIAATVAFALAESAREMGLASAVCAPLRVERRRAGTSAHGSLPSVRGIAGVLYVDASGKGSFGEKDARFFEILADCAVIALRARAAEEAESEVDPDVEPAATEATVEPSPRGEVGDVVQVDELVTRDRTLRSALALVEKVAPSGVNVLVRGESGTGKELVARALHRRGKRAGGPFVALDCGAIPDGLVPSELFGHEKHAFTGADEARAGFIERAHGGTLFLDEVGAASLALQGALLRALQEGEVRRLGGTKVRQVDVRLVAATHRDLRAMVDRGEFRQDLLYRLAVVEIRLPPLRERRCDVGLIAAEKAKPLLLDAGAVARLEEHGWPGNVRELENVLASASLDAKGGSITAADVDRTLGANAPRVAAPARTLEEIEKQAIVERLEALKWNQVQVAQSLGMDRSTLHRKIVRYGIARGRGR